MTTLGYIVQFSDEEAYTVYSGYKKLFRVFSQALDHAKALRESYLESHDETETYPFKAYSPSKRECDNQGSVVVFENSQYIVWIDCVIE